MRPSIARKREREDEISIDETRSRLKAIASSQFKVAASSQGRKTTATDQFDEDNGDDLVEYEDAQIAKKTEKGRTAYEDDIDDDDDDDDDDNDDDDDGKGNRGQDDSDGDIDTRSSTIRGKVIRKIRGEDEGPTIEADEQGITLEPFNLKEAREEGYYNASGDFVYKKSSKDKDDEEEDDDEGKDAWLDELDEMDPALRRKLQAEVELAHKKRLEREGGKSSITAGKEREEHNDNDNNDDIDGVSKKDAPLFGDGDSDVSASPQVRCQYLQIVCDTLLDGESAAAALRRLGAGAKKRSWQKVDDSTPKQTPEDLLSFNALTDALDGLVNDGLVDAYSLTRALAKSELRQTQAEMRE